MLLLPATQAQDQFQYRQNLTRADGLPSDDVLTISQDADGFIWLGTLAGLVRYDGARFDVFSHTVGDSTTLVDDRVRDLEPIGDKLWIGTTEGISVLDLSTDEFHNYYLGVNGEKLSFGNKQARGASLIYNDRLDDIWIAGREERDFGWCQYIPAADSFDCRYIQMEDLTEDVISPSRVNNVLSIVRDNDIDSILWVGTMAGLIKYNTVTDQIRHFYFPTEPKSFEVAYNAFRRLWQMPDGRILVGTWSGGLNIFDPETQTYGPAPYSNPDMPNAFFQSIREILPKSDTEVWVTLFKSLIAYDFVNERITMRLESDFGTKEIYGADFIDRDGRIWSRLYGVHIFDPALQQFVHAPYESLNPVGEGFTFDIMDDHPRNRLTVVSRDCDALYHYYPESSRWDKTPLTPDIGTIRRFEGNGALLLSDNEIIVSAYHEIFKFYPEDDQFALLDIDLPVRIKTFGDIYKDSKGRVWVGTQNDGILRWNPSTNAVKVFDNELFTDSITVLSEIRLIDSRDRVWISCKSNLFIHDITSGTTTNLCADNAEFCDIIEVDEDGLGQLWLTRQGGGDVLVVSGEHNDLSIDTTLILGSRKLPLFDLHTDSDGIIWGFYIDQIVRLDPVTKATTAYSTEYLRDFKDIVTTHLVRDHILALGLANGIVLIDLRDLHKNTEQPLPYISRIDVREQPLNTEVVPRKLDRLQLKHHENFFSIAFSALGYTLSQDNHFEYRLVGFQDDWLDAEDRRFANYTNVPSGDYLFELRVFNSEGDLSPETVSLPINVRRHWTELWRVRIGSVILLIGLGFAGYKVRVNQIRRQEKLKSDFKMQLADVEMTALRAQMNPHFIFNCLNSIESFIVRNDTMKASLYLNDFARLIRLILQNSGSKSIPLKDELDALELYIKMESLRFSGGFNYSMDIDEDIEPANVNIPPLILQPYVENAIWHGLAPKEEPGSLTVRIRQEKDVLECTIEDDGIGRSQSAERKEASGFRRKKSMGMNITRNRIELLNAVYDTNTDIVIEDLYQEDGQPAGTRVTLNIPV